MTYESNKVLKALADEKTRTTGKRTYVYDIIDEVLRKEFPDYFRKIGC